MKFPSFYSLSFATQLRFATLLPVILIIASFVYFYTAEAAYKTQKQRIDDSKIYLSQLLPSTEFALVHKSPAILQELIQVASTNNDLQLLSIYNAKKELLAFHGKPFKLPTKLPNVFSYSPIFIHNNALISPIFAPGTTNPILGWIAIKLDQNPVQISYYQHLLLGLLIGFIGLISALLMQALLSRKILFPIARLRRNMKQILHNEFETDIQVTSSGSLGEIESGCKYLQQQYLNSAHDLEHQIEIATDDLQQSLELLEEKNIELSLDKRKIEEKIVQQSEFIANMSHEIRTPMNGIIGFTHVLLDTHLNSLQKDYVNTISSSAQVLLSIINDILDYSKIDAGKLSLEQIPVNIRAVLDEVLALAAPSTNKKSLELIAYTDIQVPKVVLGDSLRIKQILHNLVANAIKFTEQGHVLVKITVAQENSENYDLIFQVSDTGIGMSKEETSRLFNAFYQTDATISRRFGGSGLGLLICKKLCETMGGNISVESKSLAGTTFTVKLPLKKLSVYESEKNKQNTKDKKNILCIDTNSLTLKALEHNLLAINYKPVTLHDLSRLEEVVANNPDIDLTIVNLHYDEAFDLDFFMKQHPLPTLFISKHEIEHEKIDPNYTLLQPLQLRKLEDKLLSIFNPTTFHKPTSKLEQLRTTLKTLSPKLLIAEDNPVNRLLLNTLLSPHCLVDMAQDGELALKACQETQYDMLILDLQMPKRSGQKVAIYLREKVPSYKNTPILFISANASDIKEQALNKLKIKKCLQKPIGEETLLQEILDELHSQQSVIDWALCIKNLSGNTKLAHSCLAQFIEELPNDSAIFEDCIKNNDPQGLSDIAHKVKGAAGFLAIHKLKFLAHEIEQQAKKLPMSELKILTKDLLDEIKKVIAEGKNLESS